MSIVLQQATKVLFQKGVKPIMFRADPDVAHEKMLRFANFSAGVSPLLFLLKHATAYENKALEVSAFGKKFKNPIGLGAGLDKNADTMSCLAYAGFGWGTYGTMTNLRVAGNKRPWFHRIPKQKSLLVNVGLANNGIRNIIPVIYNRQLDLKNKKVDIPAKISVGLSNSDKVGDSETDCIEDVLSSLDFLQSTIDTVFSPIVEFNISCPNFEKGSFFAEPERFDKVMAEIEKKNFAFPMTIKLPACEDKGKFDSLVEVAAQYEIIQGLTVSNLRKNRTGLDIDDSLKGNISGKPTALLSDVGIRSVYSAYPDRFTIIGLGGVFDAYDAYAKIRSGASMVETVTGLIYQGPQSVAEIKRGLVKLLEKDGFSTINEAVGIDA